MFRHRLCTLKNPKNKTKVLENWKGFFPTLVVSTWTPLLDARCAASFYVDVFETTRLPSRKCVPQHKQHQSVDKYAITQNRRDIKKGVFACWTGAFFPWNAGSGRSANQASALRLLPPRSPSPVWPRCCECRCLWVSVAPWEKLDASRHVGSSPGQAAAGLAACPRFPPAARPLLPHRDRGVRLPTQEGPRPPEAAEGATRSTESRSAPGFTRLRAPRQEPGQPGAWQSD